MYLLGVLSGAYFSIIRGLSRGLLRIVYLLGVLSGAHIVIIRVFLGASARMSLNAFKLCISLGVLLGQILF